MMLKAYRRPEQSSFVAESHSLSVNFNFMRRWIVHQAHGAAVDFEAGVAKALVRQRALIQAFSLHLPQSLPACP
jgi:hypothetical protein